MFLLPLLLLLAALPTIWIVDASNGPGTNFTDLPAAVAAASSGDTIIVRPGNYAAFNVTGKALTIRGAGAATTIVSNPPPAGSTAHSTISGVPAGAIFYVSGIAFSPAAPIPVSVNPGLTIDGATSEVVVSDSVIAGVNFLGTGTPGLVVSGGAVAHVTRCTCTGTSGLGGSGGSAALVYAGSRLAADDCLFMGGSAGSFFLATGGAGVAVNGGLATLSRSSAFGGHCQVNGGEGVAVLNGGFARIAGIAANTFQGGQGLTLITHGQAIFADAASSAIVHGAVTLLSAAGGAAITAGPVTTGAAALPYVSIAGFGTPAGELQAAQPVTVTFDGTIPLAPFACIVDLAPSFSTAFSALLLGELLVPVPTVITLQGTLDAAGMFQTSLTPAVNVPSLVDIPFYVQIAVFDSVSGKWLMSNGLVRFFRS
jgi:hypothetical protein